VFRLPAPTRCLFLCSNKEIENSVLATMAGTQAGKEAPFEVKMTEGGLVSWLTPTSVVSTLTSQR
jgi:hypothetical protein